jgi:hypothetical protein
MRRQIWILVLTICCVQISFAQGNQATNSSAAKPPGFFEYISSERSTELMIPVYDRVDGSPFLFTEWVNANITLADNRKFDSVQVKLNLYENRIHFKDEKGNEKMIPANVKMIEIKDVSSKWNNAVFVSGYGANDREFFQVVTDGKKAGLLKKMKVIIKESRPVMHGPERKNFELLSILCIYSKDKLYEEKKSCLSMADIFKDDSKITTFISTNDLKCNKEKDLEKLVAYYNSY